MLDVDRTLQHFVGGQQAAGRAGVDWPGSGAAAMERLRALRSDGILTQGWSIGAIVAGQVPAIPSVAHLRERALDLKRHPPWPPARATQTPG
jgi:hypothetical protein